MRVVLQRVRHACVRVDDAVVGEIGAGFLALTGIAADDTPATVDAMAAKVAGLRIFDDADGRFNLALADVGGSVLVVSQFTLIADLPAGAASLVPGGCAPRGRRAAGRALRAGLRTAGVPVESGRFGAHMDVELVNDGPVTLVLDSADLERPRRG